MPGAGRKALADTKGRIVPLLRFAQRECENPKHAASALKAFDIGPLVVKDFDQIGMERIAGDEALLRGFVILAGLVVC